MRIAHVCVLITSAWTLSGCLFDPLGKQVKQARLHVESLEQRVSRLESSSFSGSPDANAWLSSSSSVQTSGLPLASAATLPLAASPVVDNAGTSATASGMRLPAWPFDARQALAKLARGFINVITGWVEIPKGADETSKTSGPAVGLTWGLMRGLGHSFIRTVGGVYEVVTFPFPAPPEYKPVMRPEYVFTCEE